MTFKVYEGDFFEGIIHFAKGKNGVVGHYFPNDEKFNASGIGTTPLVVNRDDKDVVAREFKTLEAETVSWV